MSAGDTSKPPHSDDERDWDTLRDQAAKKLAARWPRMEPSSIDCAVNLAVATVYAMVQNGAAIQNVPGLVWTIAYNTLSKESNLPYNRMEVTNFDFESGVKERQTSPEQMLLQEELMEAIYTAIMELPDEQRVPLVAHLIRGVPYEQIQREAGILAGAARTRVSRARRQVAAKLSEQGYGD